MLKDIWKSVSGSWKTTAFGWMAAIPMAGPELMKLVGESDGDVGWRFLVAGIALFIGGALARDNDKTSEEAGATVAESKREAIAVVKEIAADKAKATPRRK